MAKVKKVQKPKLTEEERIANKEEYLKRKRNYIAKYNSKNYRSVNVLFRSDDAEQVAAWDWIHTKYSTAGYIRDLIIREMKKEKEGK